MEIVCLPDEPVWKKRAKEIGELAGAGFTQMVLDFSGYCSAYELEHPEETIEFKENHPEAILLTLEPSRMAERMRFFFEQCGNEGFSFPIGFAPCSGWEFGDERRDCVVRELIRKSLEICEKHGCTKLMLAPNLPDGDDNDAAIDSFRKFCSSIIADAERHNVQLLIQNTARFFRGRYVRGSLSGVCDLRMLVDGLNEEAGEERFAVCADLGVINLCGQEPAEWLGIAGKRLQAVICTENDGESRSACLPFTTVTGRTFRQDWLGMIRGLRAADFDGCLIMNYRDMSLAMSHMLRPNLRPVAYRIAEYLSWQIGMERMIRSHPSRVLFGAGNMCRNFMKCYGEDYPPLFTVDNDARIHGTMFEGLEIRPPGALLSLPDDCAIIICNIYYNEITAQLREMGVRNPIECFNDEYLPSMYYDRFDSGVRDNV